MDTTFYYTAPPDKCFNELKKEAIKIWETYDDTHGYASSKVDKIKDIENVRDNFMYVVAMFDEPNQKKLAYAVSQETKDEVHNRIVAGGAISLTWAL